MPRIGSKTIALSAGAIFASALIIRAELSELQSHESSYDLYVDQAAIPDYLPRLVDRCKSLWQNRHELSYCQFAPVAQRIERRPPKPKARVRVTAGVFFESQQGSPCVFVLGEQIRRPKIPYSQDHKHSLKS